MNTHCRMCNHDDDAGNNYLGFQNSEYIFVLKKVGQKNCLEKNGFCSKNM